MLRATNWLVVALLGVSGIAKAQTAGPALALSTTTRPVPDAVPGVEAWYPCAGTFSVEADGRKWDFSGLQIRKIDGESFELKGLGKDATTLSLYIKTFNPAQILRPGLTYVSEGNLEAGETFTLDLQDASAAGTLTSKKAGCVMRVASVRGSAVKGDVKGVFETASGAKPFTAAFDLIDARYGQ